MIISYIFPNAITVSRTNRKTFLNQFNEHVPTLRHHSHNAKFFKNLLEIQNSTSTTDDTIEVLYTPKKGLRLSTFANFSFMKSLKIKVITVTIVPRNGMPYPRLFCNANCHVATL